MLRMDARVQKEGGQIMKAAIYCRLSKEDEDKIGESESIQNQKSMLLQYAIEKGFDIYQIYSDEDYSGIDRNRPAFNSMLQAASEHQFDVVLAKTQSRFTRDMELVEKYLHGKFMEWGVRFIAVVDHVDTNDTANKKSRQINGLINEWYLEDLSTNVRSVLDHKRKEGLFIGSFARYGYCKDPNAKGKLIIDPEAADVVRRIFSMALNGIGAHKIARILNDEKIPSPTAYKQMNGIHYHIAAKNRNVGLWSIRQMKLGDLRERIGYVPQKGVLFSGTIDSNLRYGREHATREELEKAAAIAQATEFIEQKEEGMESPIAQGGSNVSGGQKQRLSIARAIAKQPEIYIFDDSFSALDFKTDAALRKALSQDTENMTVFLVSQRASSVMHADKILVLDDGKMVGYGNHEELLGACGVYQEICRSQFSKEEGV